MSSAEYCVHLVSVESFLLYMYIWQNGTRCRDDVNVLWCRSYLVWLVFEDSIPTCTCFHSENFFVTLLLAYVWVNCLYVHGTQPQRLEIIDSKLLACIIITQLHVYETSAIT